MGNPITYKNCNYRNWKRFRKFDGKDSLFSFILSLLDLAIGMILFNTLSPPLYSRKKLNPSHANKTYAAKTIQEIIDFIFTKNDFNEELNSLIERGDPKELISIIEKLQRRTHQECQEEFYNEELYKRVQSSYSYHGNPR